MAPPVLPYALQSELAVGQGHPSLSETIGRALKALLVACGLNALAGFIGFQPVYNVAAYAGGVDIMNTAVDGLFAINAALADVATAGGGVVYIPKGTLLVSAAPTIPTGVPIVIKGHGRFSTTIKHLTGGAVFTWTQTHVAGEYGSGLKDLTVNGNNSTATVATFTALTLFHMSRVTFTGGPSVPGKQTGLSLVSPWDSTFTDIFVADCGDSTHPCVVIDSLATGGFNGNSTNACKFYNLHVETSDSDAIFLDIIGNATNGVDSNKFFGLKLHGNAASSNPQRPLLRLSQYTQYNEFYGHIIAYGWGTSQVEDGGQKNKFYGGTYGIGGPHAPTWAIRCTATSNNSTHYAPVFVTPAGYTTPNVVIRFEAGSTVNKLLWPPGNFGAVDRIYDDQAGRSIVEWQDQGTNKGVKIYHGEGHQWVDTQVTDQRVDLTWAVGNITVQNFRSRKYFLIATSNVACTLSPPTSPPAAGQSQRISITFRNASGGALGTPLAFSAAANGYKTSGTLAPANLTQITVDFDWDGTLGFWVEASRSAAV